MKQKRHKPTGYCRMCKVKIDSKTSSKKMLSRVILCDKCIPIEKKNYQLKYQRENVLNVLKYQKKYRAKKQRKPTDAVDRRVVQPWEAQRVLVWLKQAYRDAGYKLKGSLADTSFMR